MQNIFLGDQERLFNDIPDNSIDAIITDPPYNLTSGHKIETNFNFKNFIDNSFRVLKDNGFLVYFGQEPTMSKWNCIALEKFHYLSEIIWYKRGHTAIYLYPLRVHEKIMIFTKGKGKLNHATIKWEDEKEELIEYTTKKLLIGQIIELKNIIKKSSLLDGVSFPKSTTLKVRSHRTNDVIHDRIRSPKPERQGYILPKKLTTLWGCRTHNLQAQSKEFNIKHPTVKPIQIMERLIEMVTNKNQVVLDTFMGSGSTGVGCKNLDRSFIGFELMEEYYNIAKERLNLSVINNSNDDEQLELFTY